MRRYIAGIAASAALLTGLGLAAPGGAAAASAASGWCDGTKKFETSNDYYVRLPINTASNSANCEMSQGASGSAVSALQSALKECNYEDHVKVDGDFGSITTAALKSAQARRGTTADGIYGPNTRDALTWPLYRPGGTLTGCAPSPFA